MLRKITAIAWKENLIRFSAPSELLFFLVLPIVFTFILGRPQTANPAPPQGIPLVVVDEDASPFSQALVAALEAPGVLRVLSQVDAADDEAGHLTIPAGAGDAVRAGTGVTLSLTPPSGAAAAEIVAQQVRAALADVTRAAEIAQLGAAQAVAGGADGATQTAVYDDLLLATQTALASQPERLDVTLPAAALVDASADFDVAAHQSAGQLVTWVFIPLLGVAGAFAYERSNGTLRRLLTLPATKTTHLLGVIVGHLGAGLVQMALLVGFGVVVIGVTWGRAPGALAVMLFTFGLAAVAFGTMLGTFIRSESQASSVAILTGMGMALLGGCWFPLELFPPAARAFSAALPTRWAMQGLTDLVVRGQGMAAILLEAGILLCFAAAFFAVGVWRYRYA